MQGKCKIITIYSNLKLIKCINFVQGAMDIMNEGDSMGPPSETLTQDDRQCTPSMEEMEVKVDPMLFLQCGLEEQSSEISDISDNEYEEKMPKMSPTEPLSLIHKLVSFCSIKFNNLS